MRGKKVFARVTGRRPPGPWQQLGEGTEVWTSWGISHVGWFSAGNTKSKGMGTEDRRDLGERRGDSILRAVGVTGSFQPQKGHLGSGGVRPARSWNHAISEVCWPRR